MALYLGLMSGTSADGIDVALIQTEPHIRLIAALGEPYAADLQARLRHLALAPSITVDELLQTEQQLTELAAQACLKLLKQQGLNTTAITAIGSHGHTLRHRPQPNGFSWQLNNPALLTELTGITSVADFRRRDIAAGGQGAPLVPAFHQHCFGNPALILNIGGIANLTVLHEQTLLGFDTGPGNALMDEWCQLHFNCSYDAQGALAHQGKILPTLLDQWLAHDYFRLTPPKSTGRELFSLAVLGDLSLYQPLDILASLSEFTALSIAQAVTTYGEGINQLYICGGGVHNSHLLARLGQHLPEMEIQSTNARGIEADWLEAMAFAWLAERTLKGLSGNLPSATGAAGERILGAIYPH